MPDSTEYKPVSCELHSELELAIMHSSKLNIERQTAPQHISGKPLDIFCRNQQEFLKFQCDSGEITDIRLDDIRQFDKAE